MKTNRQLVCLILLSIVAMSSFAKADDWVQWRGPDRTGLSKETGLAQLWPEKGPAVVWNVDHIGQGYSTVSVRGDRLFTQGNIDGQGFVLCLSTQTGAVIWKTHPPTETEEYQHGKGNGARGTPTLDGDLLFTIGGGGDLTCLKADSGSVVWSKHLVKDFGGSRPGWGFSESPLVDGEKLIVTPGGLEGCVVTLNKQNGDVIWRSKDAPDFAHYSSAIVFESNGVRQVLQFTGGSGGRGGRRRNNSEPVEPKTSENVVPPRIISLDSQTGRLLWSYDKSANGTANVATPIFHKDKVFSSSAYGTGGGLVKLAKNSQGFTSEQVYFETKMANHHGGIVLVDGYLYGFGSGGLICMNFETGEIAWQARSVSKGSIFYADGFLYCYGEKNEMALVAANPKEYIEKGRFEVPSGDQPTWAHPVVANGRMYLRDMQRLTCYDVKAK
ncbi:MAG: PQQ-binding-like beta-propeller repeat protein [Pirellula sp.]